MAPDFAPLDGSEFIEDVTTVTVVPYEAEDLLEVSPSLPVRPPSVPVPIIHDCLRLRAITVWSSLEIVDNILSAGALAHLKTAFDFIYVYSDTASEFLVAMGELWLVELLPPRLWPSPSTSAPLVLPSELALLPLEALQVSDTGVRISRRRTTSALFLFKGHEDHPSLS